MSQRVMDDSKVLSVRVPINLQAVIKEEGKKRGMSPSAYARVVLYEKFLPFNA